MDHKDFAHGLHQHLDRRVAVSGNVVYPPAQGIGILNPDYGAIVANAEENFSANRIGEGYDLPGKRGGEPLLEFERSAFSLLNEDGQVCDRHRIVHMCFRALICLKICFAAALGKRRISRFSRRAPIRHSRLLRLTKPLKFLLTNPVTKCPYETFSPSARRAAME